MKLLVSFTTYPRKDGSTYELINNTYKSLFNNQDLSNIDIDIIVVGDDYPNIDELKPIFKNYKTTFYNINQGKALRNYNTISKTLKWKQAVQRSKIFIFEKVLQNYSDYDYILMSADDELYLNKKIETSIQYIKNNNYPDFIFNLGIHINNKIIPEDTSLNYPIQGNCISSGCIYKIKNKDFIHTILNFRKNRWKFFVKTIYYHTLRNKVKPEDAEQWEFLESYFKKNHFTSILIPQVLIHHYTEKTIFNSID